MSHLLSFVFNKLSDTEMKKLELFLQSNNFYADIVDELIDLITERDFTFEEAQNFLQKSNTNNFVLITCLKLNTLYSKFNQQKISLVDFEIKVKQWFKPAAPTHYGIALMSRKLQTTSPKNKNNYTKDINFTLAEPITENDKIFLSVFESKNEIPVFEIELNENTPSAKINIDKKNWHPGIYYWRMQALQSGEKAEGEFYINKQLNPFE